MAWRIDEAVIRGEIDNRVRGRVTGRIWFVGRDQPVELELAGNAWRDLAGRRLEFVNPQPKAGELAGVSTRQTGVIGDCTASRKVKVPEVSMDEVLELYKQRKPFPWHWGNSLYLEWFSTTNGRVMIESASYTLTIDPESAWEMTEQEEEAQRRANGEAMGNFMGRIGDALASKGGPGEAREDTPVEWNTEPQTEAEAEKMQEDSDRLADRINARVNKEGIENYEKILDEELERWRQERGEPPPTPEEEAEHAAWLDEINRAAQEAADNPDPELAEELERKHPVAERAFELALRLTGRSEEPGWIPDDATQEHPVVDLVSSVMSAAVKLGGVLNGESWPPDLDLCAAIIVRLKRARGFLDHALLAAEFCGQKNLVDAAALAEVQREIDAIAHECDLLIGELRAMLKRGW